MVPVSLLWAAAMANEPAYGGAVPFFPPLARVPSGPRRPRRSGAKARRAGPGGLPPEVWAEVFSCLVPPKPERPRWVSVGRRQGEWSQLGRVRLVCREFDAIVSDTRPELAARLGSVLGRRFLQGPSDGPSATLVRWLGRARSVDLTLSMLAGEASQHDALNVLLTHAPRLRRLSLRGLRAGAIDASLLQLERVPLLEALELQGIQLNPEGWFGLGLEKLPQLRRLTLAETQPARGGQRAFFVAPPSLEVLHLTEAGLKFGELPALQLHRCERLRALSLDGVPLHDEGFVQLCKVALPRLEELSLRRAHLTDRAFRAPNLALLPRLRVLDLSGNVLGGDGTGALNFAALTQLRGLDLSNNRLGNQGFMRLRERLPEGLAWLEVGHNDISAGVARAHDLYTWPDGAMAWRRDQLFAPAPEEAHWLWRWLLQVLAAYPAGSVL